MKANMINLTATQLRRAADIKDNIAELQGSLSRIFNQDIEVVPSPVKAKRRSMPKAARLKIAKAARLSWKKAKAAGRNHI